MSNKPCIAVTGPNTRWPVGWWAIRFNLWLVGLTGFYVFPGSERHLRAVDGLIISGGDDIHPQHYPADAQARSPNPARRYDPQRDALEIATLEEFLPSGIPILGICRGAQLLNIVLHGSLHNDIRPHRHLTPNRYTPLPVKTVQVSPESQLGACVTPSRFAINSLHNQAVDKVGEGLIVTARDADGFVQAIEHQRRFVVGLQWHPEYLPYLSSQREIFRCFARAVRQHRREVTRNSADPAQ